MPLLVLRACSAGPFFLRKTLFQIYQDWDTAQWGPCPIAFSDEEIAANQFDFEEKARSHFLAGGAMRRLGCDTQGWVPNDKYDEARRLLAIVHTEWLATNGAGVPFPFTDGASSESLN